MADLPIFEKLPALDSFEPEPEMADWAQLLPPVPLDPKRSVLLEKSALATDFGTTSVSVISRSSANRLLKLDCWVLQQGHFLHCLDENIQVDFEVAANKPKKFAYGRAGYRSCATNG